jgi:hypothetical protein
MSVIQYFTVITAFLFVASSFANSGEPKDGPPAQASAVGYIVETFNSNFDPAKFDMSGSNAPGKEWYLWNFFKWAPNSSGITFNSDGSLQMVGAGNSQIVTAATLGNRNWVGTAFGGGGYFEATLKFDPALVNTANGWPAFWSMAIEHLVDVGDDQWAGQAAGYNHFIEADFFEYDLGRGPRYIGALHDWYGLYNVTCSAFCGVTSDYKRRGIRGVNWNAYHTVGMLWVPATSTTEGYAAFYLDNVKMGTTVTWSQFTSQPPPPAKPWTFGVFDGQHISLVLGTGVNQGLTVQSVKVWQSTGANNLVK